MIKPGKVTCAALVAIMMVLPSNLWRSSSARADVRVASSPQRGFARNGVPKHVRSTSRR